MQCSSGNSNANVIAERKISCDRKTPVCRNCIGSNRPCHRYTVLLSWPRTDDRRRAMVAHPKLPFLSKGTCTFINTTWRDVELHNCVSEYRMDFLSMKRDVVLISAKLMCPVSLGNTSTHMCWHLAYLAMSRHLIMERSLYHFVSWQYFRS